MKAIREYMRKRKDRKTMKRLQCKVGDYARIYRYFKANKAAMF